MIIYLQWQVQALLSQTYFIKQYHHESIGSVGLVTNGMLEGLLYTLGI